MIQIGNSLCLPSSATIQELFSVARDGGVIPDISLEPVLTSFLSLDSSAALEHQYSSLRRSLTEEQLANFNHNLTSELGGSGTVNYGGVGVVALALSILFDLLAKQVRAQGSTVGVPSPQSFQPQRIFSISSSSRIGFIIHGYLQRVPAISNDHVKMAEITELYDNWLKLELIDHYERMTNKKKRMGSDSMQQWLAGAAVHLHMRIHQVRLQSVPAGSAESLRLSYMTGFSRLVQGYNAYLRRNVKETPPSGTAGPRRAGGRRRNSGPKTMNVTGLISNGRSLTNMSSLTRRLSGVSPNSLIGRLNGTNTSDLTVPIRRTNLTSSKVNRLNGTKGRGETVTPIGTSQTDGGGPSELTKPTGGRRPKDLTTSQGLLVVEPLKNVSHGVQHHACESPAIEQALVNRIIDAQDLERNKEFFLYGERVFSNLLRQRDDFELKRH